MLGMSAALGSSSLGIVGSSFSSGFQCFGMPPTLAASFVKVQREHEQAGQETASLLCTKHGILEALKQVAAGFEEALQISIKDCECLPPLVTGIERTLHIVGDLFAFFLRGHSFVAALSLVIIVSRSIV